MTTSQKPLGRIACLASTCGDQNPVGTIPMWSTDLQKYVSLSAEPGSGADPLVAKSNEMIIKIIFLLNALEEDAAVLRIT